MNKKLLLYKFKNIIKLLYIIINLLKLILIPLFIILYYVYNKKIYLIIILLYTYIGLELNNQILYKKIKKIHNKVFGRK